MNWNKPCAYDEDQKRRFHTTARVRLRQLATALRLLAGSFDLRSNKAGIAISGEVTLHHARVYIQVSQPAFGGDTSGGVLIRTCRGRRDYVGGLTISSRSQCSTIPTRSPIACAGSRRICTGLRLPESERRAWKG